jgi:hypothetical protein
VYTLTTWQSLNEEAQKHADRGLDGDYGNHEDRMRQFAYAQVYATLAVAAATQEGGQG